MMCKCGHAMHKTSTSACDYMCFNKRCLLSATVTESGTEWHKPYVKVDDVIVMAHDPTREYLVYNMYLISAAGAICMPFDKTKRMFCLTTSNDGLYTPKSAWRVVRHASPEERAKFDALKTNFQDIRRDRVHALMMHKNRVTRKKR